MAKDQKQKDQQKEDKKNVKVRLSMEEARELFGGELPQAYRKPPPEKKGIKIDYASISLSVLVTIIIFIGLVIYFDQTTGKNLIEPLEATPIQLNDFPDQYRQEANEIRTYWNQGNIGEANTAINNLLQQVRGREASLAKRLYLLKLRARMIEQNYEGAQELAQFLRTTYSNDEEYLAQVMWYRGLSYYYKGEYFQAVSMFEQVAEAGIEKSDKAARHAEDIRSFAY